MRLFLDSLLMDPDGGGGDGGGGGGGAGGTPPAGGGAGGTPPAPGGGANAFLQQIPEALRGDPIFANVKDVGDLATQFQNTQRLIGAKGIIKPGKDAKPEEMDAFYNALGRPEKIDGYKVPTENMPQGIDLKIDDPIMQEYLKEAHRTGQTDQQFAANMRFFAGYLQKAREAQQAQQTQAYEAAVTELKQRWGNAFQERLDGAQAAVKKLGGDKLVERLKATGLDNDPDLADAFSKVAAMMADDEVVGSGGTRKFTRTPQEAQAEIARKRADAEFNKRLFSNDPAAREAAQAEIDVLYKQAYPEPKKAS